MVIRVIVAKLLLMDAVYDEEKKQGRTEIANDKSWQKLTWPKKNRLLLNFVQQFQGRSSLKKQLQQTPSDGHVR